MILGPEERAALAALREAAAAAPDDARALREAFEARERHRDKMRRQTVFLPNGLGVMFAIETGHPDGVARRHLSVSLDEAGEIDMPAAWAVAEHLGFIGGPLACELSVKADGTGAAAVHLVQPLTTVPGNEGEGAPQ